MLAIPIATLSLCLVSLRLQRHPLVCVYVGLCVSTVVGTSPESGHIEKKKSIIKTNRNGLNYTNKKERNINAFCEEVVKSVLVVNDNTWLVCTDQYIKCVSAAYILDITVAVP